MTPPLEVFELYERYLRASGAADRTVSERVAGARRLMTLAGETDPARLTIAAAVNYVGSVSGRGSRATYAQHARAFSRFLTAMGSTGGGFTDGLPVPKVPRGVPRPIDVNELTAAVALAEPDARTMLLLAAYAGLRVSEIGRVRGEDVTSGGLFVTGKGGSTWVVPLHRVLAERATLYPTSGWWFEGLDPDDHADRATVWKKMRRALDRVGSSAKPHQIRHYYGTSLLEAGANVRVVQELMRHANLNTTEIYTRVRPNDCQAAIAALPEIAS